MTDQISKPVKSERGKILADVEIELQQLYFQSLVGQELQLLVENVNASGTASGTSCRYAQIRCPETNASENDLVRIVVDRVDDGHLWGQDCLLSQLDPKCCPA